MSAARVRVGVAVAAVALLCLSGCDSAGPRGADYPDPGSIAAGLPTGAPDGGDVKVAPPGAHPSVPWGRTVVDPSAAAVDIAYVSGACDTFDGIALTETESSVRLGVFLHHSDAACTAQLVVGWLRVPLAAPLGDRELIHVGIDPGWEVYRDTVEGAPAT